MRSAYEPGGGGGTRPGGGPGAGHDGGGYGCPGPGVPGTGGRFGCGAGRGGRPGGGPCVGQFAGGAVGRCGGMGPVSAPGVLDFWAGGTNSTGGRVGTGSGTDLALFSGAGS